ncbi:MarR family winged helix-turn-helix transcriptional regulator [Saccharopolyspora phatthalungensis]|uniref:DNA-binding MarR family transcriptional regulator n=1 Tax=Saccharopolyspora phatthalungensis TaxID=664693 RepID=A0A840Q4S7_9PSEU|nr:MarR family transcriptional regulator [Saccharopolyspora phatthalungensis]MBB5154671.1 DNA-binding MarR family transcriptional regulator [Saccharopolyspora phatthalungensis]
MHEPRLANLLGAAALAVTDEVHGAVRTTGLNPSQVTALVLLRGESGLSVTELAKRIGIHQTACTRMVDALQERGLVERRHTVGKWTHVHPTEAGLQAAEDVLQARGHSLLRVIARLGDDDRRALVDGLEKLLTGLYEEVGSADRICRMCDRPACTPTGHACPVGAAERAHRGP